MFFITCNILRCLPQVIYHHLNTVYHTKPKSWCFQSLLFLQQLFQVSRSQYNWYIFFVPAITSWGELSELYTWLFYVINPTLFLNLLLFCYPYIFNVFYCNILRCLPQVIYHHLNTVHHTKTVECSSQNRTLDVSRILGQPGSIDRMCRSKPASSPWRLPGGYFDPSAFLVSPT